MPCWSDRRMADSNNHFLQLCCAEKHLKMNNLNGLQQLRSSGKRKPRLYFSNLQLKPLTCTVSALLDALHCCHVIGWRIAWMRRCPSQGSRWLLSVHVCLTNTHVFILYYRIQSTLSCLKWTTEEILCLAYKALSHTTWLSFFTNKSSHAPHWEDTPQGPYFQNDLHGWYSF